MKDKLNLIFIIILFISNSVEAQMIVEDVNANTTATLQLRTQVLEQRVAAASKVLLSAMQGDVFASLEALTTQTEILKNAKELRTTLGDVVQTADMVKNMSQRVRTYERMFERTTGKMEDLLEHRSLSPESVNDLNSTLRNIRRLVNESNELYVAAMDTKDEMSRMLRLEKIQESSDKLNEAEKELDLLDKKMYDLEYEYKSRPAVIKKLLPPTAENFNEENKLTPAERSEFVKGVKDILMIDVSHSKWGRFFNIVSNYINGIFIMLFISLAVYLQRTRGAGNTLAMVKSIFMFTMFYSLLRIVIAGII